MISDATNPFSGYRGKLGGMFYKRIVNGRDVIQKCPTRKKFKSEADMPVYNKMFRRGVYWAKAMLKNEEVRAQYQAVASGFNSPYTMAMKDYMTNAVISHVNSAAYHGNRNERITICVENVIRVKAVKVSILSADGMVLESNLAQAGVSPSDWFYITTHQNPQVEGSTLLVEAWDLPNHRVEWSVVLKPPASR